jgi:hypothetical protein
MSQLLTDLQSLLSTFSGTSSSGSSGTTASSASDTYSSVSNSGTTAGTLSQDVQQLSTDLDSLASTLGTTPPGATGTRAGPAPPPPGPPPGSSDILNSGTVAARSDNSGTPPASTGWATFMQQFAAGAYGSGYDSSATSSLMAINA